MAETKYGKYTIKIEKGVNDPSHPSNRRHRLVIGPTFQFIDTQRHI